MIQILKDGAPYVRALDSVAPGLLVSLQAQEPTAVWSCVKVQMGRPPKDERMVAQSFHLTRAQAEFVKNHGGADLVRELIADYIELAGRLAVQAMKAGYKE